MYHQHREVDAPAERLDAFAIAVPERGRLHRDDRLGVGVEAERDTVVELLRRMRFRKDLAPEELDEATPIAQPVVAGVVCPPPPPLPPLRPPGPVGPGPAPPRGGGG